MSEKVYVEEIECSNCGKMCNVSEHNIYCGSCGKIFIKFMSIMDEEDMEERSHNRRTGIDVDQVDG